MEDIFAIYPNPASNSFSIQQVDTKLDEFKNMNIEIYSINGGIVKSVTIDEGQVIDISQLPVGMYNVLIKVDGLKTQSESLIKMK